MTIGISGILHVGKEALFAQQAGVGVTAHNIANVNTPGYSKQNPLIRQLDPQMIGGVFFGRGAQLETVYKSYDSFLNNTIVLEKGILGQWEAKETFMLQAETVFNETNGEGLANRFNEFWDAWQDLAVHPEGIPERTVLQSVGQSIANNFLNMSLDLERVRADANDRIAGTVSTINRLAREISVLNKEILGSQTSKANANDLTDQRSLKIEEMSELIDVNVIEEGDGEVTVLTSSGKLLVSENLSWELSVQTDPNLNDYYSIIHVDKELVDDITNDIKGGSLRGLLDVRDTIIPKYIDNLDVLAATFISEVN